MDYSERKENMKLPIKCEVQYIDDFISEKDSRAIFDWIYTHVEGLDYEDIEMADGSVFRLSVGKCMFVDEQL
ncbi:MAG: hypothetical protein ACI9ES_002466, partial [Oceanospirillaceae bacterium]